MLPPSFFERKRGSYILLAGSMPPIRAILFDLDGTLVQTETLKGDSYGLAAHELDPTVSAASVAPEYQRLAGRAREEVARELMRRFRLEDAARARMKELQATSPEATFLAIRLRIYEAMLRDADLIRSLEYPYAIGLVRKVRARGFLTGMATMSERAHARRVLEVLQLSDAFDVVVTPEDVEHGKPDPEMYLRVAELLHMAPADCLVIDDSVPGVQSALAAGMICIASVSELTRADVGASGLLPDDLIVERPEELEATVERVLIQSA
jgi:beta-phosphoglucomutase